MEELKALAVIIGFLFGNILWEAQGVNWKNVCKKTLFQTLGVIATYVAIHLL